MNPESLLPLRPVEFQILASLSRGERHGYSILQDIGERGEGSAVPGMATLYRAILRLEQNGLIARVKEEIVGADDERRRTYTLTPLGRSVVVAEARRLEPLMDLVRKGAR